MIVYEGYTCYGPYIRKDGRQHVVLINRQNVDKQRITVSYPKYIVERYLNRYLTEDETIDHIDGNFSNNSLSNLRIVSRKLHAKSHTKHRKEFIKHCVICNKIFRTNNNNLITCSSKSCRGKCAHINGHNKGNSFIREKNEYLSYRSLVEEILSVEGANSGNSLVENPEQD